MTRNHILLIVSDKENALFLKRTVFVAPSYRVSTVTAWNDAEIILQQDHPDLIVLEEQIEGRGCLDKARSIFERFPFTPVCLILAPDATIAPLQIIRLGFFDCWQAPLKTTEVLESAQRALAQRRRWMEQLQLRTSLTTSSLQERIKTLETIQSIGHKVSSMLDLDTLLTAIVEAAVQVTDAEEGCLLLLDELTGEFYLRASSPQFQQQPGQDFRLPVQEPLLTEVVLSGKPLVLEAANLSRTRPAISAQALLYVPLMIQSRVIGVLQLDHRRSNKTFNQQHVLLASALADYSAIAIENARLYQHAEIERRKWENILNRMEEGVIITDEDQRLILVNPKARQIFGLKDTNPFGRRAKEVFQHPELLEILGNSELRTPLRTEIVTNDGRVMSAQVTPIPELGLVVTMQDITPLKEIDRIKSEFVNTVSHDLRSPLTAILGYVELLGRVGPLNAQQQEFIHRVRLSVQNITALINDLLDLGRIEAGLDARKEAIQLASVIQFVADNLRTRFEEKSIEFAVEVQDHLPRVLGNAVRLRQMLNNLLLNAHKYTPEGGRVVVSAHLEGDQLILQVSDNGIGIPPSDQPYIFDKFYRAGNVPMDVPGTGLGLAIVKSIVEDHQGRVWVESTLGKGSTFTVILPVADEAFA